MGRDEDREKRLAEALRANLKRRKAQRRAVGTGRTSDEGEQDPGGSDDRS